MITQEKFQELCKKGCFECTLDELKSVREYSENLLNSMTSDIDKLSEEISVGVFIDA